MSVVIRDGTGSGREAAVDVDNRLHTNAKTFSDLTAQSVKGLAFYLITDFIALTTTGSFSGIFYAKNISTTLELRIHSLRTCGVPIQEWKFLRDPTTGTLITGGTPIVPGNINLGSTISFDGVVNAGANGLTVTDGALLAQWINGTGHAEQSLEGSVIIPPNGTIALTCKPAAAGDVCVSIIAAFHTAGAEQ